MLLTRAVRPDRLIIAAKSFVESVFGSEFVQKADALLNFEQIINEEVRDILLIVKDTYMCCPFEQIQGLTPILLCSVPGHDASNRVEELATNLNKTLTSIAIGRRNIYSRFEFQQNDRIVFCRFR